MTAIPTTLHLPDNYPEHCIVYTGTHDNDTTASWWSGLDADDRARVARDIRFPVDADIGRAVWSIIEGAISSRAVAAVIPMQDLLVLDGSARMNVPSSTTGNWGWRMPAASLTPELAAAVRRLGERHDRC